MGDLAGKVALVTGAGGEHGIGRAVAMRLARDGADVAVSDITARPRSSNAPAWGGLTQVVEEIEALGRRGLAVLADVGDAGQVEAMVGSVLERFGRFDILVNSAASRPGRDRMPVVDLDEEAWDLVQRVNVKGTFLCCRAGARAMIAGGQGGRIINMASTSGKRGAARFAAYCASKFAIVGFTQSLALELAPQRITVNALCPGYVDTERMSDIAAILAPTGVSAEVYYAQMLEQQAATVPLGRVAHTSDVTAVAAFICSGEAEFLTGLAISISGGAVMD